MKCVFERFIDGHYITIFKEDEHFEFFFDGQFSASCDTIEECFDELSDEINEIKEI